MFLFEQTPHMSLKGIRPYKRKKTCFESLLYLNGCNWFYGNWIEFNYMFIVY